MEELRTKVLKYIIVFVFQITSIAMLAQNTSISRRLSFNDIKDITLNEASDLDIAALRSVPENKYAYAIVIANENYKRVPTVPYAINDGKTVQRYFHKCIGIPEGNINFLKDATLNDIKYAIECVTLLCKASPNKLEIFIYYAGHGLPNEAGETYLLPTDGFGSNPESGIKLEDLYASLNEISAKSIVMILDACFSGSRRDGGMLMATRGITIKPKAPKLDGNIIVFSATSDDETAFPIDNEQHGLFTYEFLSAIKDANGDITWGEVFDVVKSRVVTKSIELTGKTQTPSVESSKSMSEIWKNLKIR